MFARGCGSAGNAMNHCRKNVSPLFNATNGITLGGASITNDSPWAGKWTALESFSEGRLQVDVPCASAIIVKMAAR